MPLNKETKLTIYFKYVRRMLSLFITNVDIFFKEFIELIFDFEAKSKNI